MTYIRYNVLIPRIRLDQLAEPVARCRTSVFGASVNGGFYNLSETDHEHITDLIYFENEPLPLDVVLPSVPALSRCFWCWEVKPSSFGQGWYTMG